MPLDKQYYIHTGWDGVLEDTMPDDVCNLVRRVRNASPVLIHLRGGQVSRSKAFEKAERLIPFYRNAGVHPVVIVWESGLLETVKNNVHEIARERIFGILVKKLLKYAVGRLIDTRGTKSLSQVQSELQPYSGRLSAPNAVRCSVRPNL